MATITFYFDFAYIDQRRWLRAGKSVREGRGKGQSGAVWSDKGDNDRLTPPACTGQLSVRGGPRTSRKEGREA